MSRLLALLRPVSLVVSLVALTGCDRYDLERYYDGRADVVLHFDWASHFAEHPDGMTLLLAKDGDQITYADATNSVDVFSSRLTSGRYLLTTLNRSFAEFGTMQFYQRDSHDGLYAVANTWTQTREQAWDEGRIYMEEPERIGVAVDTFTVPTTIDELNFYDYREHVEADTIHLNRTEVIMPMTTTLDIRCKVFNIQYMQTVEGYIAGLADGFLLNQGWRRTRTGTLKLDRWRVTDRQWEHGDTTDNARANHAAAAAADSTYTGWISTSVATFGLPHGRELLQWRTPESNIIVLHFTLIDGSTIDFSYPVGKIICYEGDDGETTSFTKANVSLRLDLELVAPFINTDITLPYAQPDGTGQFDAEVNPWDDEENIDVGF